MKNKENEKYVKWGITACVVVIFSLFCYYQIQGMRKGGGMLGAFTKILTPFVYGAAIAYLVAPLCRKLEGVFVRRFKGKKKESLASSLAICLSLLTEILIVAAVILLIIPQLINSISRLAEVLPGQIRSARARAEELMASHPEWLEWVEKYFGNVQERLNSWISKDLPAMAQSVLTSGVQKVAGAFGVIYNLLLGQFVAIYLLARRKQLAAQARLLLRGTFKTSWADWLENEIHIVDRMFNGFFMGKLLDSAIIGGLCFVGCLLMRFESPILIAVIVGVTNIIPFFGPFIGAIPCALLLLLEEPMHCLMFVIFVIVLQQLDGNVIGPRILGNSTGLSGLWVMFGILLFGGLWGVGGMVVGVPLMAVIYDVVRQLTIRGVKKHGRDDMLDEYNAKYHAEGK
ncbi:MAG: AI-2E family transporter [Clostridia bacterium]|nr:AI-2E family transporter [Clostridia bacterium]